MRIYIACGLTHVPREQFSQYAKFIHTMASVLREDCAAECRYALVDSDPQLETKPLADRARLCYAWDRRLVESADLVIAEMSYPSTGVGIELQIAEAHGIPIIICFDRRSSARAGPVEYENPDSSHHMLQIGEGYVSLMALGVPEVCSILAYSSHPEGLEAIAKAVQLVSREPPNPPKPSAKI